MPSQELSDKLAGRTLWIPPMSYTGGRMAAAVFCSIGIDARITPPSDDRTLELGALHSSGEECYPQKVTLGDFLRVVYSDDFEPDRTAFFLPMAEGPCRFGQYAPYLSQVLTELGYEDVPVICPSSRNGYNGLGDFGTDLIRLLWSGLVAADILRKMLLRTRPYETTHGDADEIFEKSVEMLVEAVAEPSVPARSRMDRLVNALVEVRDLFRALPAKYTKDRPLIAVVGEIFCRLNQFSNYDAVRKIESHGGEVWLSDITEWVWYTNWSHKMRLKRDGKIISLEMLGSLAKTAIQRHDEERLLKPFRDDFVGYEEPHDVFRDVLKPAWPYLPADGVLGEMVLSIGKSIYMHGKGIDGVIDISPFSCMNGIICEAVYHVIAKDHDDIPIRNFYFDATSSNMDRDLDIFMELAESYCKRKKTHRQYPACFEL